MGWINNLLNKSKKIEEPENTEVNNEIKRPENKLDSYKMSPEWIEANIYARKKAQQLDRQKEVNIDKAIEMAKSGTNRDIIEQYSPELSTIETYACASIGYYRDLDDHSLKEAGGSKALVERMIKDAEEKAKQNGYVKDKAVDFLGSVPDTIVKMIIEKQEQEKAKNDEQEK